MYPIEKYKFAINKERKQVIAISTYAGKTVRGKATCADGDEFDLEKGKRLAAARCNVKIASKRAMRASRRFTETNDLLTTVENMYDEDKAFMIKTRDAYYDALEELDYLEEGM